MIFATLTEAPLAFRAFQAFSSILISQARMLRFPAFQHSATFRERNVGMLGAPLAGRPVESPSWNAHRDPG